MTKECAECGKAIGPHDYWHRTDRGPTCSARCRDSARAAGKYAGRRFAGNGVVVNNKPGVN